MKKLIAILLTVTSTFTLAATVPGYIEKCQLNQPAATSIEVKGWANEALMAVYDLNFINNDKQLQLASHYFTSTAWQHFRGKLDKSKIFKMINDNKFIVSASAEDAPLILEAKLENRKFIWKLQFPAVIVYKGSSIVKKQHILVTQVITHAIEAKGVRGMVLEQMTISPVTLIGCL